MFLAKKSIDRRNESSINFMKIWTVLHDDISSAFQFDQLLLIGNLLLLKNQDFLVVLKLIWDTKYFSLQNWWDLSFFRDYGNVRKQEEVSNYGKRNKRGSWEQPVAKFSCSWNDWGLYSTRLRERLVKNYPRSSTGQSLASLVTCSS